MKRQATTLAVLVTGLLISTAAAAQGPQSGEPTLVYPAGQGFSIGGAYQDFTDSGTRGFTTPGGGVEARYVFGTRSNIAGEAAYIGTLNGVNALGLDTDALLMSNGIEAAARFNILTDAWQPYLVAGVGWKHYDIVNTNRNTSDFRSVDNGMTIPLGVGLAYRYSNIFADVRAMYRPSVFDDIARSSAHPRLDTMSANLNIGFEF